MCLQSTRSRPVGALPCDAHREVVNAIYSTTYHWLALQGITFADRLSA
jgi:hypothetical protein